MTHETSSTPLGAGVRGRRGPAVVMAALALGAGVAACDGGNAFGPVGVAPSIVALQAPETAASGTPLEVYVAGVAVIRLDSVVVTVEGGTFSARQRLTGESRQLEVDGVLTFNLPSTVTDTVFTIEAFAVDAQRNVSLPAMRTVRVLDGTPPTATLSGVPEAVRQGETFQATVTASDNLGLRWIGVDIRGPGGAILRSDSVSVSGLSASTTFTVNVPATPVFGAYEARAFARDVSGNRSTSSPSALQVAFVDLDPPTAEIESPASGSVYVTGDSLVVTARATDNDQLVAMRFRAVALVGDPALGTDAEIARFQPVSREFTGTRTDTTLTRVLPFNAGSMTANPPTSSNEAVAIIVEAEDGAGFVTADTVMVTLQHDVSAPSVSIQSPSENDAVNAEETIPVSVIVADNEGPVQTGVNFITIQAQAITGNAATGGVTVQQLVPPVNFTLQDLGRSSSIVSPFTLNHPLELSSTPNSPDRFFFLIVTARDVAGNIRADTIRLRDTSPP